MAEPSSSRDFSVFRQKIGEETLYDAVGPWPYLWIQDKRDIDALYEEYRHLVTLAVVTQPGYVPQAPAGNALLLKEHFVYDPSLPPLPFSKRTRARLHQCEARGSFEIVTTFEQRMEMARLYRRLKERRQLAGRYVEFPDRHFETIARSPDGVFFEARDANGIGAIACGFVFEGMLQILHTASSDEGLRWNASYLLMAGLQSYARERHLCLFTGGMPDSGTPGLHRFKERWANRLEPIYMLQIINDPAHYAALTKAYGGDRSFFPAYRARI